MRAATIILSLAALALLGGGGRLIYLEETQGAELRRKAEKQQAGSFVIPAQRGDILDAAGRVLAGAKRRPSIYADATLVDDPRYAAHSLAPVLGMRPSELERLLLEKRERGFVWIQRDISDATLTAFNDVRRARRLNAFGVVYEPKRVYPFGTMAAQVLGFVGADQHGLAGVEQQFDAILSGSDGKQAAVVDARRRLLRQRFDEYEPPRDGHSVVLTLEAHIQQRTEYHLKNAVDTFKSGWGMAVVMHPGSGEILAMATYPAFDPADPFPNAQVGPLAAEALEITRNRAIADAYEPGSIFKPFVAAPAVEARITRLDEVYAINGPQHKFGSRIINDTHAYGALTLREVISKSSNIGMGLLGARVGSPRLHEFVKRFGFGEATGVTLPGEHTGLVNPLASWTDYSDQSIPIGQEIGATPLQLLNAFSVFCNGGVLYRPRIVRGIIAADGTLVEDHSAPILVRRVLEVQTARKFRLEALVEAVRTGTGKRADIADYQVFGKTGTAQVASAIRRGYEPGAYVGSFLGGAPAEEPRAIAIVSIYKPSAGGYYGGTVAAPAVGAILADTLAYMGVPPEPHERAEGDTRAVGGW